ncbi:GerW family sporulation protein [Nocardiopsis sp. NPDC055551]|uniref:GerW family sporulation protein n=1 Tax=Nocardiopsis sp. NPDC006832 TaxID=3157188 RepID=UPI0033DC4B14
MAKQDRPRGAIAAITSLIDSTRSLARTSTVFGDPVTSGATTVVPVARISVLNTIGGGTGKMPMSGGDGAGGMGLMRARPAGFLVVSPEGAAFRAIHQPAARLVLPLAAITAVAAARIVSVSVKEARRRKRLELECGRHQECSQHSV